ncbi:MAG: hypothetical protein ACKOWD_15935 [Rhodoferax sp.]
MTHIFQGLALRRALGVMAACGVAAALLMSCGGQSLPPTPDNGAGPTNGGSGGSNAPGLVMAGAYQGTAAGSASEFVSFVTPDLHVYLLYALQVSDPHVYPIIYTGVAQIPSSNTATVTTLKSFQYPNNLRSGSASVSGSTATAHTVTTSNLSIPTLNASPQFSATAMATTADAQGTWIGTWADGLDGSIRTSTNLALSGTAPGPSTGQTGFGHCDTIALTLTPATDAGNTPYFAARADISAATGCLRNPAPSYTASTLTGIAFIHAPSPGVKRLEIILTDPSGSGISFRGDQ